MIPKCEVGGIKTDLCFTVDLLLALSDLSACLLNHKVLHCLKILSPISICQMELFSLLCPGSHCSSTCNVLSNFCHILLFLCILLSHHLFHRVFHNFLGRIKQTLQASPYPPHASLVAYFVLTLLSDLYTYFPIHFSDVGASFSPPPLMHSRHLVLFLSL